MAEYFDGGNCRVSLYGDSLSLFKRVGSRLDLGEDKLVELVIQAGKDCLDLQGNGQELIALKGANARRINLTPRTSFKSDKLVPLDSRFDGDKYAFDGCMDTFELTEEQYGSLVNTLTMYAKLVGVDPNSLDMEEVFSYCVQALNHLVDVNDQGYKTNNVAEGKKLLPKKLSIDSLLEKIRTETSDFVKEWESALSLPMKKPELAKK